MTKIDYFFSLFSSFNFFTYWKRKRKPKKYNIIDVAISLIIPIVPELKTSQSIKVKDIVPNIAELVIRKKSIFFEGLNIIYDFYFIQLGATFLVHIRIKILGKTKYSKN